MGSSLDPFKLAVELCPEDLDFIQHLLTLVSHSHMSGEVSEAFKRTAGICVQVTSPLRVCGGS